MMNFEEWDAAGSTPRGGRPKPNAMMKAVKRLEAEKGSGRDNPLEPERLPLTEVVELSHVFQVRGPYGHDEGHVADLLQALREGRDLAPVTVWRCGQRAILIDGHHRLDAYRQRATKAGDSAPTIPVEWFRGSVNEAVAKSAEANNERKLPLTPQQRTDYAWRLVCLDTKEWSKARIAELAGVAARTVATMRAVKKKLDEVGEDPPENWTRARQLANGRGGTMDFEEYSERQAGEWSARLRREFSTSMARSPQTAARALMLHFGRTAKDLVEALADELGEDGRRELIERWQYEEEEARTMATEEPEEAPQVCTPYAVQSA